MLAAVRPSDWNWLLLGHLLAAFALVAGLTVVTLTSLAAARSGRGEQVPEQEPVPVARADGRHHQPAPGLKTISTRIAITSAKLA